jgi:putative ABC transport system permease protein
MKTEDPGFKATEVVYIDNLTLYNSPKRFESVRNRIKAIPGVKNVTVASNIPGGIAPTSHEYLVRSKALSMNTVSVDYEYFETLNIKVAKGSIFSLSRPADSVTAVVNEAAAKLMDIKNPVGISVAGRGSSFKIIGVIKDVKANGFEEKIQPTIYLMKDHLGLSKIQIMISAERNAIPEMLKTLSSEWSDINKPDGDNFNYHFLDELYGQLFIRQEQLQTVLILFSGLAIFIAALGLFSSAAHAIRLRVKEVAIRKVFGASVLQIVSLLSVNFIRLVLLAITISIPIAWIALNKWLESFAYKIDIGWTAFILGGLLMTLLALITVCFQTLKVAISNPVKNLRTE